MHKAIEGWSIVGLSTGGASPNLIPKAINYVNALANMYDQESTNHI